MVSPDKIKLAFLLDDIGHNQLAYLILRQMPGFLSKSGADICLYYENPAPPCLPHCCGLFPIHDFAGFDGVAFATSLLTAQRLARSPGPKARFFYCWDLQWLRMGCFAHQPVHDTYRDTRYDLLARTEEHRQILEEAWNRPVAGVVGEADLNAFWEIAKARYG